MHGNTHTNIHRHACTELATHFLRHVECCEHHLQGVNSGWVDVEKMDGFVCVCIQTFIRETLLTHFPAGFHRSHRGCCCTQTQRSLRKSNFHCVPKVTSCTDVKSLADEGQNKPPAPILTCMFTRYDGIANVSKSRAVKQKTRATFLFRFEVISGSSANEGVGTLAEILCVCVFECVCVGTRAIAPRCTRHGWIPQLYAVHRETVRWQMKWHHFHPTAVCLSLFTSADCLSAALVFALFHARYLCVLCSLPHHHQ